MVIIYQERGTGKTCTLIELSARNNMPIATAYNPTYIKDKARELNLTIPEPIKINTLADLENVDKVYIDDAEAVIQKLFPCSVQAITMSIGDKIENLF